MESSCFCGGVCEARRGSHCQPELLWLQPELGRSLLLRLLLLLLLHRNCTTCCLVPHALSSAAESLWTEEATDRQVKTPNNTKGLSTPRMITVTITTVNSFKNHFSSSGWWSPHKNYNDNNSMGRYRRDRFQSDLMNNRNTDSQSIL